MSEKKSKTNLPSQPGKTVAESPIFDVFDGRHPAASEKDWAETTLAPALEKSPEKPIGAATGTNLDEHGHARFSTISNAPVRRLYTQADLPADWDSDEYLGYPGEPPYTRGIHATGYRGKLWTMRMFSGFASPEETNQRYKYLLEHGGGGLSVAFDLPTLMGYDSDHPASEGEVGKCGVAIDSLEDMEILFDDHQFASQRALGDVSRGRGKTRSGLDKDFRHYSKRYSQGVHRAEGVHLSSRAIDAPGDRYL
jgi:Methylmalonyl-CoA mutase